MRDTHINYVEQLAAPRPNWFRFVGKMMELMKSGEMDSWMAARKGEFEAI